ncbi:MAG: FKBP-type peptidyl-prolyl cis-trans isomerase [Dysgonamonadaceae bacterium]|jgi:FKBP-type peptidyl-prolyl cis-trans isomerase FklB|nr:FKBP-type peptidyl-prolyl cis-trans isomerase [Dysgonamonadaceae bacterium]MDD3355934.1 FKBP-type peptidyl-prolyl cis-trans isomerase [Dysgonamonadaceae bacterium]MDD3727798.1 FKBP-type peptidyl-prolyl cis-trans isomerase [Dysgonamonadaceae bacterium]MDD4246971.1 FKBP-type peptidyl-prolyl cis-trans isomerase [Dysgonamonadaceae bacterium]MDD4606617.1 FKBP-type peptidyl-prolyl cis-trans isomerase [Dysgonamonadaceae bacterium]
MKKIKLHAIFAFAIGSLLLVSCGNNATPKASLKTDVDSLSYAYGVNLADQGLMQYLEQLGVVESASNLEYEYQMKISAADSTERDNLQKELKSKVDSLNKTNAPKLNEFLKGLKEAVSAGEKKSAYIQGLSIGNQISQQMLPQFNSIVFAADTTQKVNTDQLIAGLVGTLKNQQLAISKMDAGTYVQSRIEEAQKQSQMKSEEDLKNEYQAEIDSAEQFLKENGEREEVVVLPSGLQYEIIKKGTGAIPTDTDQVKVHYHGTLLDGTVFDSSVDRNEPAVFGVTQVIPGWTEALKLMPVGSKWKVYVPYSLGYGAEDRGTIKPFSTLIFEVELLAIEK